SAAGNPVAVAADDGAEIERAREVPVEGIEAEGDVGDPAGPIGCGNGDEDRSVRDGADFDPRRARQREQLDRISVCRRAERRHSFTRSAILIGRFWSMLFRMAMPV